MDNKKVKENCAKASGLALPISTKQSIEICKYIRGRNVNKAISMLQRALDKKEAVPFTRFNNDMGHKPGKGPGRYPQKASKYIIELLKSVKANALAKGLNTDNLIIKKLVANKASRPWRYGRQRRRKAKRTHIEIIVKEIEPKTKKENKKSDKKQQESNKKQEIPNKKSKKAESKSKKKEEGKESAKKTVKKDNKKAKEKKRLDKEEKKE